MLSAFLPSALSYRAVPLAELRCFQRFSRPHLATERCRWRDNSYTRGAFNPVLSY